MSLYWDCKTQGCYKEKCVIDWKFLSGVFIRDIRPMDIDGAVEVDGAFLFFEWKNEGGVLEDAQRWFYERLTKLSSKITVFILYGNSEKMELYHAQWIKNGFLSEKKSMSINDLKRICAKWSNNEVCSSCGTSSIYKDGMCNDCYYSSQGWEVV